MSSNSNCIGDIVDHIYLNSSIIDILIRICCVQQLDEEEQNMLNSIRNEILTKAINKLEHH
jgi:hypothetical protein